MTWATEAAKTTSRKIVLAEIDIGREYTRWVNEGPGIWKTTLYWTGTNVAYGFKEAFLIGPFQESGDKDMINPGWTAGVTVGSVQEDGTELTERASYALMYANAGSFYWDEENQIIYVRMTNDDYIHEHNMVLGITLKLTNDALADDLGEGYYEERLISVPAVSKTKDNHVYGLIQHAGGSFEIDNADGALDWIDNTTWPDMSPDDIGKPIPIFYGQVNNAPAICVNWDRGAAPAWIFKVCDVANHFYGIEEITKVYVDGVEKTPTPDLANGTFTLAVADYSVTQTVTFDGKGLKNSGGTYIEKALDVIEDLLSVYLLITYDATNYDTTAWAAAEANAMNNNVGLWIDSPTEIIELIEMLCTSTKGNFIRKDSDGKYTFRFTDIEAASTATIIKEDYQESPRIYPDGDSMLSVVRVGYNKNIDKDSFSWNVQDSERTRIFSKYTKDRDLELETALLTSADAQELAEALYELFDDAEPIVELVLWSKYLSLEIMDVITVPVQRVDGRDMIPAIIGEVIHLNKDPLTGLVTVQVRRLRDA